MPATYHVSVGAFEGPFDLLLHLIARHKVDIYEIPIAQITDEYLAVMRDLDLIDLEVATEFLVVAATLLELKAARLLPGEDDPELDELALEARDLLYARLLDYRTFRDASGWFAEQLSAHAGFLPREVALEDRFTRLVPRVDLPVDAAGLAAIAVRVLTQKPPPSVDLSHVQPVRMTVREAADMVLGELDRAGGQAPFREIVAGCRHRVEVIVCFLALLELYKAHQLDLDQPLNFGELVVTRLAADAQWIEPALEALGSYDVGEQQ